MENRIGKIGKMLLASFMIMLASAFFVFQASGAVGVKADDWAKFTIDVTLDLPEGVPTTGFEELVDMEWVKVSVEAVSGSTITGNTVVHYKNGTEDEDDFSGEVGTAEVGFMIEANLTEGDSVGAVPFVPGVAMTINGTESRKYAGASREVNYVRISIAEDDLTSNPAIYWDKLTGFLCEMSVSYSGEYEGDSFSISMDFKMTETNMWEATDFLGLDWWIWIVIIIVIVVVVGGAVVMMRRGKPSEEQTLQ